MNEHNFILDPWPWYVSGPLIALVMLSFLFLGKFFGMSSYLRTICAIGGAGRIADLFRFNWKAELWGIFALVGVVCGGYIGANYLSTSPAIDLNPKTVERLELAGFESPGAAYVPAEIFSIENAQTPKGLLFLSIAGLLIGFGTRYAGGCTSGHAISGLSNLQRPSLIAVIGFFIGGIIATHFILPLVL